MGETVSDWPKYLSLSVHELRAPLVPLSGYLGMLLKGQAGELSPAQRKLLEEIHKSSGRLSTLLKEMSDLGQLLDGRQAVSGGQADLSALLRDLCADAEPQEELAGVRLVGADTPMPLAGDRERLRQVLQWIIHALRRELTDSSELEVRVGSKTGDAGRRSWIVFGSKAVADALQQGRPEQLEAFDVYRGGCGLVLPIARHIIHLYGGRAFALRPETVAEVTRQPLVRDEKGAIIQPKQAGGVLELPLPGS